MSVGELLTGARRAFADAFEPREFAARPTYGIGYVPVSSFGSVDDDPRDPNVWRRLEEARSDADTAWLLCAGAIVLAAVVDVVVITRHRRARARKGERRAV